MRFCTNCGERLSDEQAFCPNCGTPVRQETPKPSVTFETGKADATPKKKHGWLIALIVVLCVLVVGVLLLGYFLLGWFRAPHARLQTYLDNAAKLATIAIAEKGDADDFSTDGVLSFDARDITLPADAELIAYYYFGMDMQSLLSGISLDLNVDADAKKQEAIVETALRISGGQIMGYTFTADEDGFGAYASATDQYAAVTWDTLGVAYDPNVSIDSETLSELVLALSDAGKLLLTEESVGLQRGYRLECVDGEEVKCSRYIVCPGRDEWEGFFEAVADLVEDNDAASSIAVAITRTNYGMTADEVADMIRSESEHLAELMWDSDVTFEFYMERNLPVGAAFSLDDSETSAAFLASAHGNASSGVRGVMLNVENSDESLTKIVWKNVYSMKDGVESGDLDGTLDVPDAAIELDGEYEGKSFDIKATVRTNGSEYPISLKNDCREDDASCKGTFSFSLSAPQEDGEISVTAVYDLSKEKKSVFHAPYGSCKLSFTFHNVTYTYDDMLSNMGVTLTVEEARNGGSDHILTIEDLKTGDLAAINEASVILSTTDEPSTAKKPSFDPEYGDMSALQDVIRGGVSLDLQ